MWSSHLFLLFLLHGPASLLQSCPAAIDEVFNNKLHIIGGVGIGIGLIMVSLPLMHMYWNLK